MMGMLGVVVIASFVSIWDFWVGGVGYILCVYAQVRSSIYTDIECNYVLYKIIDDSEAGG